LCLHSISIRKELGSSADRQFASDDPKLDLYRARQSYLADSRRDQQQ
jgi:hypothetical protein